MTEKALEQLEINALALRKIADTVLEQVRAATKPPPVRSHKKKQVDRVANLKAQLLAGKYKSPCKVK